MLEHHIMQTIYFMWQQSSNQMTFITTEWNPNKHTDLIQLSKILMTVYGEIMTKILDTVHHIGLKRMDLHLSLYGTGKWKNPLW